MINFILVKKIIQMYLYFFIGIISWTLTEYVLHRFLGHEHKGKNFFKREHVLHHARANYFVPLYKKILIAVLVSSILFWLLNIIMTKSEAFLFILGYMGAYLLYELTHLRYHSTKPLVKPFIILRKHHFYHHFHNPKKNHGVTTRFWDRVFGTFERVEQVQVPKPMTMEWLMYGENIHPTYAKHFRISKR